MEFARIKRTSRPITMAEWNKVIASQSCLEGVPDRKGINPFTKEEVTFPGAGKAYYVEEGEPVGSASLEEGEILTTAIPRNVCQQIAQLLAAKVFKDDRS
jgi:hypothetical protein